MSFHCFDGGSVNVVNANAGCSDRFDTCPRHNPEVAPSDYERGIAEGERRERARVVADLRALALAAGHELDDSLRGLADRYERGEHEREGA